MNKNLLWIFCLSLFASCADGGSTELEVVGGEPLAVEFSATTITTRVNGDRWSIGDRVGIFTASESNIEYYISSAETGVLTPASRGVQIFVDSEGEKNSYVAYHPFVADLTESTTVEVDLSDQSDLTALEIVHATADNIAGSSVDLTFDHKLAKLTLDFTIGDDSPFERLEEGSVLLSSIALFATYCPYSGLFTNPSNYLVSLPLSVAADGKSASAEALVVPMADISGAKMLFVAADGLVSREFYFASSTQVTAWEGGSETIYEIEL